MTVIALLIVASQSIASLHIVLSMSSTRASKSLKTKLFQWVHYKFLCMVFPTIPSKFACATFKTFKILLVLWQVLAHEEVVVGFVIFHTKLSTHLTRMLHLLVINFAKSWLDHHNRKKVINRHSPMVYECWQAPEDSVSHGLCKQRLGECQAIYKVHAINV